MLFGRKKKEQKPIPIDEIKKMASRGMSDKDIIKELKHKGFDYKEIEKAMLQAVQEGVEQEPMPKPDIEAFSSPSDIFNPPVGAQPSAGELPAFEDIVPEGDEQSDIIIEELIEGIVEEKWEKFEGRASKIEESLERISTQIKQYDVKLSQGYSQKPYVEDDARMNEVVNRIEELDARVGGLEKAFKQFLPSLTKNIESLSHMIHEMKERTNRVEMEEEAM